ncbi:transcription initiation factor TFIID subunit 2 [Parastagonospora nodorum]|nr:transcription initiation factor TFIID subunit 2 [Parastagonospora nodorum]KAH5504391.1 transcription initiation factor TFIID subunit 2 [Parastagonospora nodorum]KAH5578833.1 transcription initiation factor TFIID subunit 2 [Parastagonospora nodorum]
MAPPLEIAAAPDDASTGDTFQLLKQTLELDISFCPRQVTGKTTLDILPERGQLREVILNARQLKPTQIKIEGQTASFNYSNLHQRMTLYPGTDLGQYHFPKDRIQRHVNEGADELVVYLPDSVKIREVKPEEAGQPLDAQGTFYAPLKVEIDYVLDDFRDGLHFAGVEDGDSRFPHAYTRNSPFPGTASCLFPCIDDGETRCPFDVSIRYPRTMGDALSKHSPGSGTGQALVNGVDKADSVMSDSDDDAGFSEEEKAMEMQVICSGVLTDDILDPADSSRKTASFTCESLVLPQHVGFVIGPFEHVDLSDYRDLADEERLAESAIKVHAFCLPGREDEVRNSAMMLARALDSFTERFQSYAFGNAYKLAFVDDLECDASHTASFSICSSRLLFPETIWEPLEHTTRVLVHAVASQWIGVDVIARDIYDYWIIVGASWFMAELYLRELFGRNDWRFRQKLMVDKVIQMDKKRPSLQRLGQYLQLDHAEQEFMELKSLMVLSILHNRLVKQSGKNGVDRCLYRLLFNARQGKYDNGAITTEDFLDICEKVGHQKLDSFFSQWVVGSGCPNFECFPSFNKKKQVVQLQIRQIQADSTVTTIENALSADDFMREAKESAHGFLPGNEFPTFVGPMTIRIHEADGTPYEHIVDINSSNVKVEIPYNTKYKRLKRNRLNKERQAAAAGLDASGEAQEDVTFYMLGDVFGTAKEQEEWRLSDWPAEDEAKMEGEAYEWIRIDADFEWICRAHINDMPSYMYVSQLQQDKDVVAQYESIQFLASKEGHRLISTFLVKTLMDNRYFHGIRTYAADVMAQSALKRTEWTGLYHLKKAFRELFCIPGSPMTRSNDFSDRSLYLIQCAIPKAISKIKGEDGRAPLEAKRFLLDIIRYNDNRGNEYSDDYYISTLMHCLADCLTANKSGDMELLDAETERDEFEFTKKAIEELTRHQRLDEWIPTYQNVYTTTALDCARKLIMNRVTPFKPSEFLQYAQLGNADNVRLKAWDCLVRLGMLRKDAVLKFLMHDIRSDPSPYFRKQLLRVFSFAIGQIATGDVYTPEKPADNTLGGLVVETDADNSDRASQLARQNLNGAQRGLKTDLQNNQTLKDALEEALNSKTLSTSDMLELLDFCNMVFDHLKRNTLPIVLRMPRYWRMENLGQGRLRFTQTGAYRKRSKPAHVPVVEDVVAPVPLVPMAPVVQVPPPVSAPKLKMSLKLKPAGSPPPPSADPGPPKSRQQSGMFSPPVVNSPTSLPESAKASRAPTPAAAKPESRAPTPKPSPAPVVAPPSKPATPAPVVKTPVPPPAPPAPVVAAPSRPAPAPVSIPTGISTPPAIHSPIPLPTTTTKLKIKTKLGPASASARASAAPSPRPSAAPSPRPSAAPSPRPSAAAVPTIKAPTPASSSATPKGPKQKRKIVKLFLRPELLARFTNDRKRKLQVDDSDRPLKRQSLEPKSGRKTGLVQWDKYGGDKPRLIVKMKVGKGKLPIE